MTSVQIRNLIKVHNQNRRSANEQQRELAHLRHRSYRGVPVTGKMKAEEINGTFTYRGVSYTK